MAQAASSKEAAAALIDPMNEPEPSAVTGLGASFGSTFAPKSEINGATSTSTLDALDRSKRSLDGSKRSSDDSKNPYRSSSNKSHDSKNGVKTRVRAASGSPRHTSREKFPDYRAEAFADYPSTSRRRDRASSHAQPPSYQEATSPHGTGRRRGSSLKERYPGDKSAEPLDIIRKDSKKAYRSPHLNKRSMPGADMIDRLDPAIGGRAYHHEGPYDAALLSRNRDDKHAPLKALENSNEEALKATPRENIKDAVEHHKPLVGTADVPPGSRDRFGREYRYQEGADVMHEPSSGDAGYKRWNAKDYDPNDLKGEAEPGYSLDQRLRKHTINDDGIEMQDRSPLMKDHGDPVELAGGEQKYADMEISAFSKDSDGDAGIDRANREGHGSLRKRIGSLKKKMQHHD